MEQQNFEQNQENIISYKMQEFLEPTIFQEIVVLTKQLNAINIASGSPNYDPPQFLQESLINELKISLNHQYGTPGGQIQLKNSLVNHFKDQFKNVQINSDNIYISNGASGIIFDICQTILNKDDEVIFFDPHFPLYKSIPKLNEAKVKSSQLIPPQGDTKEWGIDFYDFESKFNQKTKLLILCSPNNPTGKIFNESEYLKIAQILEKYPKVQIISDEVYDFLAFDKNQQFVRFANISEQMAQRTITVGSLSKLFCCTGWRCGYGITLNKNIMAGLIASSAQNFFSVTTPIQMAFSKGLDQIKIQNYQNNLSYIEDIELQFRNNYEFIIKNFSNIQSFDWEILPSYGGYFVIIDIKNLVPQIKQKYLFNNNNLEERIGVDITELKNNDISPDIAFSKQLIYEFGISVLPTSTFYLDKNSKNTLIRISLSRTLDIYQQALQKLQSKEF